MAAKKGVLDNLSLSRRDSNGNAVTKMGVTPPILVSVFTVFTISFITPLAMGGTISLAVALEGEDVFATSPDNMTGHAVTDSGVCNVAVNAGSATFSLTNQKDDFYNTDYNTISYSSSLRVSACDPDGEGGSIKIKLPSGIFNVSDVDAISRFDIRFVSTAYSSTSGASDFYTFGWEIAINGTKVIDRESQDSSVWETGGTTTNTESWKYFEIDETLTGIESRSIMDEVESCLASCDIYLTIQDLVLDSGGDTPFDKSRSNLRIRTIVYTTSADTASTLFQLSPYVLSAWTMLIAVAATPYWNPVGGLSIFGGGKN